MEFLSVPILIVVFLYICYQFFFTRKELPYNVHEVDVVVNGSRFKVYYHVNFENTVFLPNRKINREVNYSVQDETTVCDIHNKKGFFVDVKLKNNNPSLMPEIEIFIRGFNHYDCSSQLQCIIHNNSEEDVAVILKQIALQIEASRVGEIFSGIESAKKLYEAKEKFLTEKK